MKKLTLIVSCVLAFGLTGCSSASSLQKEMAQTKMTDNTVEMTQVEQSVQRQTKTVKPENLTAETLLGIKLELMRIHQLMLKKQG